MSTANNILGLTLLFVVVVMEINRSAEQQCLPTVYSVSGHALTGTEYQSFTAEDYPACLMKCAKNISCMSVNFLVTTGTCDLNTQSKESRPDRFHVRIHSIYSTNLKFAKPIPVKGMKELPGKSCLDILVSGTSVGTGQYWIDPPSTGNPIEALCDMTTDGGGWTIVKQLVRQSPFLIEEKVAPENYNALNIYSETDFNINVLSKAMLDIKQKMGFHQMYFYCHKRSVGTVVNIMTKNNTAGQRVVRYFTDDVFAQTTFPDACGSFDRLPEDTSFLAKNCDQWGVDNNGNTRVDKWGRKDMYAKFRLMSRPFGIEPSHTFMPSFLYTCDDSWANPKPLNAKDTWKIAVR